MQVLTREFFAAVPCGSVVGEKGQEEEVKKVPPNPAWGPCRMKWAWSLPYLKQGNKATSLTSHPVQGALREEISRSIDSLTSGIYDAQCSFPEKPSCRIWENEVSRGFRSQALAQSKWSQLAFGRTLEASATACLSNHQDPCDAQWQFLRKEENTWAGRMTSYCCQSRHWFIPSFYTLIPNIPHSWWSVLLDKEAGWWGIPHPRWGISDPQSQWSYP